MRSFFPDPESSPALVDMPAATMTGDPHFRGFEGETFDFMGEPQKFYNLLTDRDVHVNAFFTSCSTSGAGDLTVVEHIGILVQGHRIQISPGGLTVDGCAISERQQAYHIAGGTIASIKRVARVKDCVPEQMRHHPGFGTFTRGYIVTTRSGYEFVVIASTSAEAAARPSAPRRLSPIRGALAKLLPTGSRGRACLTRALSRLRRLGATLQGTEIREQAYLNLVCRMHGRRWPHGIIGQTADHDGVARQSLGPNGEGVVAGGPRDYEVGSLWGTDYTFNKYLSPGAEEESGVSPSHDLAWALSR